MNAILKRTQLMVAGAAIVASQAVHSEPCTVAISESYAPAQPYYQCALDASGIEYEIVQLPQSRVLYELEHGRIDAGFPFVQEKGRDDFASLSLPVIESRWLFVTTLHTGFRLDDPDIRWVYLRGSRNLTMLNEQGIAGSKFPAKSWHQAFDLLEAGRVEALLTTEPSFRFLDMHHKRSLFVRPSLPLFGGIYVDDDQPELLASLNSGIEKCGRVKVFDL